MKKSEIRAMIREMIQEAKIDKYKFAEEINDEYDELMDNEGKLWGDSVKGLSAMLKLKAKYEKYIKMELDDGTARKQLVFYEVNIKEMDSYIIDFEDINPILKKLKKGKTPEEVRKIMKSSKYWDWKDDGFDDKIMKLNGPMDLYIKFNKAGKLERWNF